MNQNPEALRAIDANVNRAQEALRVVEDVLRFVENDAHLTNVCKKLRHELSEWCRQEQLANRVSMRDASADVGRTTNVASEYERQDINEVLMANLSRAQQSLRALEEFSKTIDVTAAKTAEQIRYKVYDLEKAVVMTVGSRQRLAGKNLYVLVDGCGGNMEKFRTKVETLCENGVDIIQLREKSPDHRCDRQLMEFGLALVRICADHQVTSIVNDRVDLAKAIGADGVHLGQDDLPIKFAREICGPGMLIGVSTHSIQQARQAVMDGANYIGVGPTFPSTTKQFAEFTGLDLLREIANEIALTAFAIGGIDSGNLSDVLDTGIKRVAVSGVVSVAPSKVGEVARSLKSELDAPDLPRESQHS